ncbi:MAG: choice-of-anchor tandem repeat NxxGxxAF-containing protein [Planctomycetota bacterium]
MFNQIALTGDLAPGVDDGAVFDDFYFPSLNSVGDVAFRASLRSGDGPGAMEVDEDRSTAVFGPEAGAGSTLSVLARAGDLAPGVADGAVFDFFSSPQLNASGDVAFNAVLRTGNGPGAGDVDASNDRVIVGPGSGSGMALSVLARTGNPAPGVTDGAAFLTLGPTALTTTGDVTFTAFLRTGDGPGAGKVDFDNDGAFFGPRSDTGSALGILVRERGPSPGVYDGSTIKYIQAFPITNSSGDIAFSAVITTGVAVFGPRAGTGSRSGILVRDGAPAPGVTDVAEFGGFDYVTLNDTGDVAFITSLRTGDGLGAGDVDDTNQKAVFGPEAGAGSALGVLVREGDPAPGVTDDAVFDHFGFINLNAAGDIAFRAWLRGGEERVLGAPDPSNVAVFGPGAGAGSALDVLARAGDPAPGVDDGAVFRSFDGVRINAAGTVTFGAALRTGDEPGAGEVNINNQSALFAYVNGVLELIVREGDLFTVDLTDSLAETRTISHINSSGGFNDAGEMALSLAFTDGTSGIFTVTIPEPGVGALLAMGIGLLMRRSAPSETL